MLVFPLVIVAVGVGVFVLFGLITTEGKGPRDYLDLIRAGDSNRRWQAAYELSKVIQESRDPELSDPRLVGGMVSLFEEAGGDDPRVRRFLALALGRLGDAQAVPALLEYLRGVQRGEGTDSETHIYAVWALGAIGEDAAIPELVALTTHEDPGLRKTAVHALGVFRSEEATAVLERALGDPVDDVRWNAASGPGAPRPPRGGAGPRADAGPRATGPERGGHTGSGGRDPPASHRRGRAPLGCEARRHGSRSWATTIPA